MLKEISHAGQIFLQKKIPRARLESRYTQCFVVVLGQYDDPSLWKSFLDLTRSGQAVHAFHPQVHRGPLRLKSFKGCQGRRTVVAFTNLVACVQNELAYNRPHFGVVFDDQHSHHERRV